MQPAVIVELDSRLLRESSLQLETQTKGSVLSETTPSSLLFDGTNKTLHVQHTSKATPHQTNTKKAKETKPRFVWHVGPLKTGTTSIQDGLSSLDRAGFLAKDGWYFAGHSGSFRGIRENVFRTRFKAEMDRLRLMGKNVILSNENFSLFYGSEDYRRIREVLGDDWDVTVVIGYRPYFDWIPSMWSQSFKLKREENIGKREYPWHDDRGEPTRRIMPMFPSYHKRMDSSSRFADSIADFVKPYFNIQMLHLYDPKGLQAKLVCDILQARAACAEGLRKSKKEKRANQANFDPIHSDVIAMEAARNGLINTAKWKRIAVIEAVMAHLQNRTMPMVCPNEDVLERLWEQSLEKEVRVYPELAAQDPARTNKLREGFQKKAEQNTYCRVDLERVLADPDWRNVLAPFA